MLVALSNFMVNSGLRKASLAVYFYAINAFLLFRGPLPAEKFSELGMIIILAALFGNVAEHYLKARYGGNGNGKSGPAV